MRSVTREDADRLVSALDFDPDSPLAWRVDRWFDALPAVYDADEVARTFWLIERGQPEGQTPTVWWWLGTGGREGWTEHANEAFRFHAPAAAQEILAAKFTPPASRGGPTARVTEHSWLPPETIIAHGRTYIDLDLASRFVALRFETMRDLDIWLVSHAPLLRDELVAEGFAAGERSERLKAAIRAESGGAIFDALPTTPSASGDVEAALRPVMTGSRYLTFDNGRQEHVYAIEIDWPPGQPGDRFEAIWVKRSEAMANRITAAIRAESGGLDVERLEEAIENVYPIPEGTFDAIMAEYARLAGGRRRAGAVR